MANNEQNRVLTTISNGIAEVRLNRPGKHNGLDLAMFEAIVAAGEALIEDKSVRAVVLRGEGRSFCAGLDFKAFMMAGEEGRARMLERPDGQPANLAQQVSWVWTRVPVPVIVAVHGSCIGGGLHIALGADIRIVHPEAKMSVREIHYGLIPDMGMTATYGRYLRHDLAKELTFTGRMFDGREALSLGLATRLAEDPLLEARELAKTIAGRSPDAVRACKKLWDECPQLGAAEALARETALQLPLLGTANQLEAVRAAMMRIEPSFKDVE